MIYEALHRSMKRIISFSPSPRKNIFWRYDDMFEYVTKEEVKIAKLEIEEVIHKVQKFLKGKISFQYHLIGSASNQRNLVTRIINGNQGFDLDYNIELQSIDKKLDDAKTIKKTIMDAFNKCLPNKFKRCSDSTSVFTIKRVNNKKIIYSYDFAIVNYYNDKNGCERQEYIKFVKPDNYSWTLRPIKKNYRAMIQWVKNNVYWDYVKKVYLEKKI